MLIRTKWRFWHHDVILDVHYDVASCCVWCNIYSFCFWLENFQSHCMIFNFIKIYCAIVKNYSQIHKSSYSKDMIDVVSFAEKFLIKTNEILMKLSNWNFIFNYCCQEIPYVWRISSICCLEYKHFWVVYFFINETPTVMERKKISTLNLGILSFKLKISSTWFNIFFASIMVKVPLISNKLNFANPEFHFENQVDLFREK